MFSLSAGSISRWEIPGLHHLHKTLEMCINMAQNLIHQPSLCERCSV
jgi:hypothetical protein